MRLITATELKWSACVARNSCRRFSLGFSQPVDLTVSINIRPCVLAASDVCDLSLNMLR